MRTRLIVSWYHWGTSFDEIVVILNLTVGEYSLEKADSIRYMENKICFRSYLLCVHISLHSITTLFSVLIIRTVKNCSKIQLEGTIKCPNLYETTNPIAFPNPRSNSLPIILFTLTMLKPNLRNCDSETGTRLFIPWLSKFCDLWTKKTVPFASSVLLWQKTQNQVASHSPRS